MCMSERLSAGTQITRVDPTRSVLQPERSTEICWHWKDQLENTTNDAYYPIYRGPWC